MAGELAPLVGSIVQKVRVSAPRTVCFALRRPGDTRWLLVDAQTDVTRAAVVETRPHAPDPPLPLQGLLRAELLGASLIEVDLAAGDRVLTLRFSAPDGPRSIVAELTGRHGNLFLLDETGRILMSAVPNLSTRRPLVPGELYTPPMPPPRTGPMQVRVSRIRLTVTNAPEATLDDPFPASRAVEELYAPLVVKRDLDQRRREVLRPLRRAQARLERALEKLAQEARRAEEAPRYQRYGELLKPHLGKIKKGETSVRVPDWSQEGAPQVAVPLNPALSPRENMEKLFKVHRRYAASAAHVAAREKEVKATLAGLETLAAAMESAKDEDALERAAATAQRAGHGPDQKQSAKRARSSPSLPYREFMSMSGQPIWVGKGAEKNDDLTFHYARGNDVWMHARGVPGSHVVVPCGSAEPDAETVLDAATLAVHYSSGRGVELQDVAVTRKKYVRKPRGAPAGAATYSQEKTLALRRDEVRLRRLMRAVGEPD